MSSTHITEELKKANITDQVLAELKGYLSITVTGIEDRENYDKAKEAKKICQKVRTTTEKLCKKGREDAIAEQKAWIAKEKEIVAEVRSVEDHMAAQMKIIDDEEERVKELARRTADLPVKKLRLLALGQTMADEGILAMTDVEFVAMLDQISADKAEEERKRLEQIRLDRHKQLAEIGLFFDGQKHYRGTFTYHSDTSIELVEENRWEESLAEMKSYVEREIQKEIDARTPQQTQEIIEERETPIGSGNDDPRLHPVKPADAIAPTYTGVPAEKLEREITTYLLEGTKLFFFDVETTGLLPQKHGIHQISGCIMIDGQEKEEFNFKVRPNPQAQIDDEALRIGGVTIEQIATYPPMKEVYLQLVTMLAKYVDKFNKTDKFFLVGYNNRGFDDQFLRGFFKQNLDEYFGSWFWADSHDVLVLASAHLMKRRAEMENFKLATVAKFMGIEVDESKLHDASYDIALTKELYLRLI